LFRDNIRAAAPRAGRLRRCERLLRLLARRAARRLRRVPWRHAWIIALTALLLILALFGLFRRH